MVNLLIWQFIALILFLAVSVILLTIPGWIITRFFKIPIEGFIEKYVLSTLVGIVVFTLFAYLLAFLNLRIFMWMFPILGILFVLKNIKLVLPFIKTVVNIKLPIYIVIILIFGVIGQVLVNAPSGLPYSEGIYFWSAHGRDGMWHLALMEEMHRNNFPFDNPQFAGHKVQNYHFFTDLFMSEITRLFHFSNLDIYFRFIPVLFSILLGLASFIFVKLWSGKNSAGLWAMFFTYFSGSLGFLLTLARDKTLGGESIFWISQPPSVLGNPPQAAAFIIIIVFMYCFLNFTKTKKNGYILISALLAGSIIGFKVYAGIVLLAGLFIVGLYGFLKQGSIKILLIFVVALIISFLIYLPNSNNSGGFIIWEPWWYIRTMVIVPDRLNWMDMELRRQTYISENNWKRVIQLETTAFLIFFVGNLGVRILGFWRIIKSFRKNLLNDNFSIFYYVVIFISLLIPLLFLQKGVVYNSIQFAQYFLLLFGFLAAISISDIFEKIKLKPIKILITVLIIIFAIPTHIGLLRQFYFNSALSKISYQELSALQFLKEKTSSGAIILTAPFNRYEKDKYKNPPIPISAWSDTSYVSAISSRRTLISDEEQLDIMGYKTGEIIKERKEVFDSVKPEEVNKFLKKYKVDFIYLAWGQKFAAPLNQVNITLAFDREHAKVYKVNK